MIVAWRPETVAIEWETVQCIDCRLRIGHFEFLFFLLLLCVRRLGTMSSHAQYCLSIVVIDEVETQPSCHRTAYSIEFSMRYAYWLRELNIERGLQFRFHMSGAHAVNESSIVLLPHSVTSALSMSVGHPSNGYMKWNFVAATSAGTEQKRMRVLISSVLFSYLFRLILVFINRNKTYGHNGWMGFFDVSIVRLAKPRNDETVCTMFLHSSSTHTPRFEVGTMAVVQSVCTFTHLDNIYFLSFFFLFCFAFAH